MKEARMHRGLKLIKKSRLNSRGFTLVEAVVSIALIAIVSIVMYSIYFSMSRISKYSEEQIKRYAVIRVIKENVAASVRQNTYIHGTTEKALGIGRLENLPVKDLSAQEYPEYAFDLEYMGIQSGNIIQYKVSLKHSGTSNAFEFLFEVYKP